MPPAVLYLHGTRWNLTAQVRRISQLRELGFSVLAIDYRGFGESPGDLPSERTVYQDAQAAWERLVQLQPEAERRFIYGHSLGGAIAVDLAEHLAEGNEPKAAGLIVESTFTDWLLQQRQWPTPRCRCAGSCRRNFDSHRQDR